MAQVIRSREPRLVRRSAAPYLGTLAVGTVLGLWAGYLWPARAVFKGQAPAVLVPLLAFAVSLVLWVLLERRRPVRGWALAFLVALAVAWVVNLAAFRFHGDSFTYGALLFLPILLMVGLKPPTWREGRLAFLALAWVITAILAITRLLEMSGLLPVKFQPQGIIQFDTEYYWLPINHALGIEGRWPGPFGHNGYTAMMGAFIIVIAVAFWSRSSWVFIPIGVFTLVITSGRASVGAAAVGLILIAMMTTTGRLGRVPRKWRVPLGLVVLLLGGLVLFGGKSGLTGRQVIWPAFLELWKTSPWTGVGGGGIAVSGGITQQFGHAHSMYLDLLVRDGVFAFATVMVALAIALGITIAAGVRGMPGPLAILAAFLITGITEPRNDWLHPGTDVLMVVLCVMTAAVALRQDHADRLSTVLREEKVT